jgi:acyl-coenzyme A synthetase/AMP-(fatty) acid ligase/thioesterase domain-containing protein/acyl carrier protein
MAIESGPDLAGVARVARDDPGRVALELFGHQLTYAEVDLAANRLAQRLLSDCSRVRLESGANSGDQVANPCVPLLVEGTAELLVAAEAIQRAGLVCVPLDPNSPDARVNLVLDAVGAPVLVTDLQRGSVGAVPCRHPLLDGLAAPAEGIRREPGPVHSIVFTSGSSGRPKGIVKPPNQYGTVSEFLRLGFGVEGALRVGILTAGSVAASVPLLQILLENGFTIVAHEMRRQHESIDQWLRRARLDAFAAVPTLLRHILASLAAGEVIEGLRFMAVFGESTTWEDVGRLRQHLPPGTSIFNVYGQGEAGSVAVMPVGPDTPIGTGLLPVGHPLPGRTVSIVDEEGQPVPAGGRGEIVVEGPSVSLGYWREEAGEGLSGVFTKNDQGVTVVRTGDAGRLRADGVLEHLGRLDHVVKIAGNRVDLGEIETALTDLPHVTDAVASTYIDDAGELRLRAFVVVNTFTWVNTRALRGQLGLRLARSLLPDVIEVLNELPRLPNGKVDRQGLPTEAPKLTGAAVGASRPPTEEIEHVLASLWASVLGIDDIGLDDDFFDLGGDSFRAVRLSELIERQLDVDMPAWMLIEHPTVAELAASLSKDSPTARVVTIQSATDGIPIFVTHDNFGSLFGARQYLTALGLQQPIYGLRASAWEGRSTGHTLEDVAADHVLDILATHPTGPLVLYGQATGALFAFEIARQLMAGGSDVALLVVTTAAGPALPVVPSAARMRALFGSLSQLPRREVPRAVVELARFKGRQLVGPPKRKVQAEPSRAGETKPEVSEVLELYGAMALHYRAPSHYSGAVLLIKPSWLDRPIEDRWQFWVDGPLRIADVEELRADLFGREPRRLESLAPQPR